MRQPRLSPAASELVPGFFSTHDIATLLSDQAAAADACLTTPWDTHLGAHPGLALLATGGYGRGELHPFSDIDLLILGTPAALEDHANAIETFVQGLWELGRPVGHSVRSIGNCLDLASTEISVFTSLMEARSLAGSRALFMEFQTALGQAEIWPPSDFLDAKLAEQTRRHARFSDNVSNLEPHIKEGPGGLRDLQTVLWIAQRTTGCAGTHALLAADLFKPSEIHRLLEIRRYLCALRFSLHTLARRGEERLLFDYQKPISIVFGGHAAGDRDHAGVEGFMQAHYRQSSTLDRLSDRMLQAVHEQLSDTESLTRLCMDSEFEVVDQHLGVRDRQIFRHDPTAILRLFLRLLKNHHLAGARADTLRALRDALPQIDQAFRAQQANQDLFLQLIGPKGTARVLRQMHQQEVLGAYIPAFAQVSGRMQYDLFHVYTVDQHTLRVIENIESMRFPPPRHEFPHPAPIAARLPHPRCLYLAALFHDIAKGRKGDHARLGARDAEAFCRRHRMPEAQVCLVRWLVGNHLLMSITAQKKDIQDALVVDEFARSVGRLDYLDYLYLLTIADIQGTNPDLWNSWKSHLLEDLYEHTRRALNRGLNTLPARRQRVSETRLEAEKILRDNGLVPQAWRARWKEMPDEYFLRHTADEIAWHTTALGASESPTVPLVLVRPAARHQCAEIFIYTDDQRGLFAAVTGVLDNLGLTVTDARIITTSSGHVADSFRVVDRDADLPSSERLLDDIRRAIPRQLARPRRERVSITRRPSRRERHFHAAARLAFSADRHPDRTLLEVFYSDRPGILNDIGQGFADCGIQLHDARIATFGNRVEDLFVISSREGLALNNKEQTELSARLKHYLDKVPANEHGS